jgi:NADH-quinone oxidoreductase subunit M
VHSIPWLTLVLVVPVGTALLLQLLPRTAAGAIKATTVAGTLAVAGIVAGLLIAFNQSAASSTHGRGLTLQFQEQHSWIPGIGASYHLGLDGLSGWLLALDAAVFLLGAVLVSRRSTERPKFYCTLLLLTETATAGVLLSADLLLFYLFWEAMLVPLYFILGSYGDADRGRATIKFIIYTAAGSLLMLVAIIYITFQAQQATASAANPSGTLSFDLQTLINSPAVSAAQDRVSVLGFATLTPAQWAFLAFAAAFAIKVPLVPFHTWLPDSYTAAPPQVLTFFAGIVSKLGAYGFIRYGLTLFPGPVHHFQWFLMSLAAVSIIYSALLALSQADIKRIVAYASISHLGFIVLGIFALNENGINGAIIQMVNHGIIIVALFLVVGYIEARTGTRDRHELSGLESRMPWLYALFLVITLAGLGMPGMNTFVGEFTILVGAFQANPIFTVLAGTGTVLACWYMLRLHQGLMHDPIQGRLERVSDLRLGEGLTLAPLVALMVLIGVFPRPIGDVARGSVHQYATIVASEPGGPAPTASTVGP